MAGGKEWDIMDIATLRREFPRRRTEEVAAMLGRTPRAVSVKAHKLGLEKERHMTAVVWTPEMVKLLKSFYPTMMNRDLAKLLGVSMRTTIRKARELGLEKVPDFFELKREQINARSGPKGPTRTSFKKGEHRNPDGEFKPGHVPTPEQRAKASESLKRAWARKKALQRAGIKSR